MADQKQSGSCGHEHLQVQLTCPACGQEFERRDLNRSDLEAQQVQKLPNREAMSLVTANVAVPINLAAALNVLSDSSSAIAGATQTDPIAQTA